MGLARKGSRTLTVGDVTYRWVVSPDDGFMVIVVERDEAPGQRMQAQVGYRDGDPAGRAQITPAVVRRVIERALREGWTPDRSGRAPFKLSDADAHLWEDGD